MLFEAEEGRLVHQGQVFYKETEMAFDFLPHQRGNCTVLIGTLNLDFMIYYENIKRASQVWGYHPPIALWVQKVLHVPLFFQGSLILLHETIEEADIVQLEGTLQWKTSFDRDKGWVCIGESQYDEEDVAVEFATNTVAVLKQRNLKALWIKPGLIE